MKEHIQETTEEAIVEAIADLQLNFSNYFQYKFFVDYIAMILTDEECYLKGSGGIYNFLGSKTKEEPETIKSRLQTIKNNFGTKGLERLGFNKNPKNKELLFRIANIAMSKVRTKNEHEI